MVVERVSRFLGSYISREESCLLALSWSRAVEVGTLGSGAWEAPQPLTKLLPFLFQVMFTFHFKRQFISMDGIIVNLLFNEVLSFFNLFKQLAFTSDLQEHEVIINRRTIHHICLLIIRYILNLLWILRCQLIHIALLIYTAVWFLQKSNGACFINIKFQAALTYCRSNFLGFALTLHKLELAVINDVFSCFEYNFNYVILFYDVFLILFCYFN